MLCTDFETGEQSESINNDNVMPEIDLETGEIDLETCRHQKVKFMIPRKLLHKDDGKRNCCSIDTNQNFTLSKKEQVITLQEEIILGHNKSSYRLFLLATFFCYTPVVAFLLLITEILIHMWTHNKNSTNSNPNIYYRSPLHEFTFHFCKVCRTEADMDEVIRLQEKRLKNCRVNLKNVARNIY